MFLQRAGGEADPPGDRAADLPQPPRHRGQGAQVGGAEEDWRGRRRPGQYIVHTICVDESFVVSGPGLIFNRIKKSLEIQIEL